MESDREGVRDAETAAEFPAHHDSQTGCACFVFAVELFGRVPSPILFLLLAIMPVLLITGIFTAIPLVPQVNGPAATNLIQNFMGSIVRAAACLFHDTLFYRVFPFKFFLGGMYILYVHCINTACSKA